MEGGKSKEIEQRKRFVDINIDICICTNLFTVRENQPKTNNKIKDNNNKKRQKQIETMEIQKPYHLREK